MRGRADEDFELQRGVASLRRVKLQTPLPASLVSRVRWEYAEGMDSAELMWVVKKLADLEAERRAAPKHGIRKYRAMEAVAADWQSEPDVPASVMQALEAVAK